MSHHKHTKPVTLAAVTILALTAGAQTVSIKSNLLYDAALSPNLGIEVGVAPKWSIDLSGNFNNWNVSGHQWKHWFIQPEARYWLCERFGGHFLAAHAIAGEYNFGNLDNSFKMLGSDFSGLSDKRYQGWSAGLGIGYGYTWMLSKHWSIEAEIAVGWIYTRYDVYPCATCGTKLESNRAHNYVGPTKAAVNLIYVF
ncbi:MAG: DUF3575 domain-containing protein [Odoribacter sp.]|nr:DUF3575 domain-containing protein [Odoribacter sp.]